MKTSLIIDTRDTAGKNLQKTITYVNPEATNSDLKVFAQKYAAISTDSYVDASRVNKIGVDEPDEPDSTPSSDSEQDDRRTPSFEADHYLIDGLTATADITYDGDGELSVGNLSEEVFARIDRVDDELKLSFRALDDDDSHLQNITGTLYATETDHYEAAKYDFNLTQ